MASNRRLRIVHCFRSPVGGIFRHVRDLALEHSAAGHDVGIVCDSLTGGTYEDGLFDDIRPHLALGIKRLPMHRSVRPADVAAAFGSYREIKQLQPDVLHGHGAKGGAYARIAGSLLRVGRSRVARFYSPHGGSLHYSRNSPEGRFFFTVERQFERMSEGIIFVSAYERDTYRRKVGAPRVTAHLVHNGLRDEEFEPVIPGPDAADFLYIGMMRDLKGPDVFIEAFIRAERKVGHPLSAVMVGDGDDKARYQKTIDRSGIGRRVRMLPAMKAREAFALAKRVVIPSRAESMPYIVMEAVAAGMPLLASRVGGIPEIVGRDNPCLVPPGDAEALAEAMAAAICDAKFMDAGRPDMVNFRERFSTHAMARALTNAYEAVLSRHSLQTIEATGSSLS